MEAKIVENFIYARSRCNFSHPLTERPLPFGSSLHVKVRVKQDKIEISLQQIKAPFPKLWNFSAVRTDAITILRKTKQAIRLPYTLHGMEHHLPGGGVLLYKRTWVLVYLSGVKKSGFGYS